MTTDAKVLAKIEEVRAELIDLATARARTEATNQTLLMEVVNLLRELVQQGQKPGAKPGA